MFTPFDLPLGASENARVPQLAAEYRALKGGAYATATEESIGRMIFEGGIFKSKDRPVVGPLSAPLSTVLRSVMVMDSSLRELEQLEQRWGVSREETIRIVVVDGLAYVEEALEMFKHGHRYVPAKGQA